MAVGGVEILRKLGTLEKKKPICYYSPFRYPGGKTWLVPWVRRWLGSFPRPPRQVVEPFAGGGAVGLTAVFENLADRALFRDLDPGVAVVWKVMLRGGAKKLSEKILSFDCTRENVRNLLAENPGTQLEFAFQTIVKNRVSYGGLLTDGGGTLGSDKNPNGVSARWYPETLAERIMKIERETLSLHFTEGDGLELLEEIDGHFGRDGRAHSVVYIDPPYPETGERLYNCSCIDHDRLFSIVAGKSYRFLMSYNNHSLPRGLAEKHGFDWALVPMRNREHEDRYEMLIGRSLGWVGD